MSHLHLPDGILPLWLSLGGWAIAIVWVGVASRIAEHNQSIRRKVPLLAVIASFVLISMSIEIVPIAYHINLTVVAGVLLGPTLAPIAALIVEVVLALLGHGGVTVIGINFILLTLEMCIGSLLFRFLRSLFGTQHTFLATALATVCTLAATTSLMVGVVALAGPHLADIAGAHNHSATSQATLSFGTFAATVYSIGPIGWVLEALLSGWILAYIQRVRPSLLAKVRTRSVRLQSTDGDTNEKICPDSEQGGTA